MSDPLCLCGARRQERGAAASARATRPLFSLVIPARNEEAYLPELLETVAAARACFRQGPERIEVIVADNVSTDRTAALAREQGCRVVAVEKRCIAAVRNGGAAATRGELLCFADADFRIHPQTFNYAAQVMARGPFVGGATGFLMERTSVGIAVTWHLIMPPLWLMGLDGGVWFCRRKDFLAIGGFEESRRAGEDVRFLRALKSLGRKRRPREELATRFTARRLGLEPPLAIASCRKFDARGDWYVFGQTLRGLAYLLFARRKLDQLIQRYWYDDALRR